MRATAASSDGAVHHRICMVCDFFYPSMGGVENHVHQLAQCLLQLGHKVVVLTHQYGNRTGVRWLAAGLKVYHVPFAAVFDRVLLPTAGILLLPLFRDILIRERITIVHSHAVCTMALECVTLAAAMGYHVVYTEHSNFGFSDSADIHLNKLCRFVLSQADTVVTVSHTSKENVSLRCQLDPTNVFVIPNAFDAAQFKPDPDNIRPKGTINVVVLTRLVWRKGTHLLVQLIPEARAASRDSQFHPAVLLAIASSQHCLYRLVHPPVPGVPPLPLRPLHHRRRRPQPHRHRGGGRAPPAAVRASRGGGGRGGGGRGGGGRGGGGRGGVELQPAHGGVPPN